MITIKECTCHPLKKFGFVKVRPLEYVRYITTPVFGRVQVLLERPWKGQKDVGIYVKAFSALYVFSFWRMKA